MGSFFSSPAAYAADDGVSAVIAVHSVGEWTQNWESHSQTNKLWKVQAMPTFVLVKGGQEVGRIVGAKKDELEKRIQEQIST
ncbi:hypothetical protein BHE74_00017955 [Ensete ventricosum]|uniref:Thioredoxin domain-containing protein n=1 Tax=Ensete ventricosum TaxID=4639 RepID=A0A426XSR8_ENSVE|nr:hypothetical protein B296_00042288 [Ensete ventricosum]RWW17335.1 hypothetical protein GW17_00018740 [Ensete ventricosum]RWW74119.1 hypothetical protein BHE74_00017955 [Ensete ventricosum]RZS21462.1 hypothetical protein BHM03_00054108 [Ensete ventricosum]